MPTFELTSPWGQKYRVNAPEGATPEQAQQILQQHLSQTQDNPIGQAAAIQRDRDQPGFTGMAARGLTGAAQGMAELGASGLQMLGLKPGSAYETQEKTPVGSVEQAGRFVGRTLPFAAAAPESLAGRALVGTTMGALQPADSAGQRIANTMAGAGGGAASNLISRLTERQIATLGSLAASALGVQHGGYGGAMVGWPVWHGIHDLGLGKLVRYVMSNPAVLGGAASNAAPIVGKVIDDETGN